MTQVTRWTGKVTTSESGGFVAYGDYLELQAENERLERAWTAMQEAKHKAEVSEKEAWKERDALAAPKQAEK